MHSMEMMLNSCAEQFNGYREQTLTSRAHIEGKERDLLTLAQTLAET
jgi:hypothetical protein